MEKTLEEYGPKTYLFNIYPVLPFLSKAEKIPQALGASVIT